MKALVLDFDGVIADSSREAYVVAARTWAELEPGSRLLPPLRHLEAGRALGGHDFTVDPLFAAFRDLVPLGSRAEDFGVALRGLEQGVSIPDQDAYDAFFSRQDTAWLEEFHRCFYRHRAALRASSLQAWVDLQPPFHKFTALLRQYTAGIHLAIATSKDGLSVGLLLESYGLDDLFQGGALLDKEAGTSKRAHLEAIHERIGVPFPEITFVDDRVTHLERVAPLGVRPVLAAWGHNTEREHVRSRRLGFTVATLDNAATVVFARTTNP